jgi:lysyl-tRNA synthetase class I
MNEFWLPDASIFDAEVLHLKASTLALLKTLWLNCLMTLIVSEGAFSDSAENESQTEIYRISELDTSENYIIPSFSLIKNLVQMPHIDVYSAARELKGDGLTELEGYRLSGRIQSAKFWLEHFATEEDKFTIQSELTEEILAKLEPEHLGLIQQFRNDLRNIEWEEGAIQQQIFDSSRMVPILPKASFHAMYILFLNKDRGLKWEICFIIWVKKRY